MNIEFDLVHDLDLEISKSNMEFAIYRCISAKNGLIAMKQKGNISIEL